jgi:thiol-disulfide isomerase/thioredoxin
MKKFYAKLAAGCTLAAAAGAAPAASLGFGAAAPEFAGIEKWLNSDPLTMQQLKGKVVLVDFWTYTCINCVNTLPYVKAWHDKYQQQGLAVIGVHTPEFPHERSTDNVRMALKRYDIRYPVAQDNRYATWDAYSNRYWPALYLFDKNGKLAYTHSGEGAYAETEAKIRQLLAAQP